MGPAHCSLYLLCSQEKERKTPPSFFPFLLQQGQGLVILFRKPAGWENDDLVSRRTILLTFGCSFFYRTKSKVKKMVCVCVCLCVCVLYVCSIVSDSLGPHELWTAVSYVHGIFQARILEWVAISYSRGSCQIAAKVPGFSQTLEGMC